VQKNRYYRKKGLDVDTNLSNEVKITLLEGHLEQYRHQMYIAEVDAEVAQTIGDEQMLAATRNIMKRAKAGVDVVSRKIEELKQES